MRVEQKLKQAIELAPHYCKQRALAWIKCQKVGLYTKSLSLEAVRAEYKLDRLKDEFSVITDLVYFDSYDNEALSELGYYEQYINEDVNELIYKLEFKLEVITSEIEATKYSLEMTKSHIEDKKRYKALEEKRQSNEAHSFKWGINSIIVLAGIILYKVW